jgi:hypothetical protein
MHSGLHGTAGYAISVIQADGLAFQVFINNGKGRAGRNNIMLFMRTLKSWFVLTLVVVLWLTQKRPRLLRR